MEEAQQNRQPIILRPEEGRVYEMGKMRAIFKADNEESAGRYSVSEWWLEPRTRGPGVHQHAEDHVYYVLEGTLSVFVSERWSHLPKGSYVVIPGETPHNFENQGSVTTGFIAINTPGGFEEKMAGIAPAMAAADLSL